MKIKIFILSTLFAFTPILLDAGGCLGIFQNAWNDAQAEYDADMERCNNNPLCEWEAAQSLTQNENAAIELYEDCCDGEPCP